MLDLVPRPRIRLAPHVRLIAYLVSRPLVARRDATCRAEQQQQHRQTTDHGQLSHGGIRHHMRHFAGPHTQKPNLPSIELAEAALPRSGSPSSSSVVRNSE